MTVVSIGMVWITVLITLSLFNAEADYTHHPGAVNKSGRVLILGAGMSGIAAAQALHEAGYQDIQILEAGDTVGGRMRDVKVGNWSVELGAMWVYGRGTNPVYKLATDANLTMTDSYANDWTVRDETGANVTDAANNAYRRMKQALHNLSIYSDQAKQNNGRDLDVHSGIRHFGWLPRTPVDDVTEVYSLDFETGALPSSCSSANLVIEKTYEDFGSYDMLAVTDKRGFSTVLKYMCSNFLRENDTRLLLNRTVESVHYSDSGVSVETTSGETFYSDYMVVTFSLGVLQQRLVSFFPPLPESKQQAIDKFGMASFSHIYVQYPYAFWDSTMYILYASKKRGYFSVWQNMNTILPGSNILQSSLFAEYSEWAEKSSDAKVVRAITEVLQTMYPEVKIPAPTAFKISRWNSDTSFHGGFSYWPASFTESDMMTLRAPVGRVHFAGEHLHPVHYGFVHGAYLTGNEAAQRVIQCLENGGCKEDCDSEEHGLCSSSANFVIFG